MRLRNADARGFSLVELMVAMTVTLIVTGAIYGLMTGGQNAFRREPAMTDRQQNVRLAMDIIMRDVASAGGGMPAFIQTFTTGLDGPSLGACEDNDGSAVPCPVGPSGDLADELEIMANPEGLEMERACHYAGSESHAKMVAGTTRLVAGSVGMVLLMDGKWTLRAITGDPGANSSSAGECASGQPHMQAPMNSGSSDATGYNLPGGICAGDGVPGSPPAVCTSCEYHGDPVPGNACCSVATTVNGQDYDPCTVLGILQTELVRYRIREDDEGVPNLERWSSGRTSNYGAGGRRLYQVIARGIDDLQVEYFVAGGGAAPATDDAPIVDQAELDYGSLIQTVRVTLSARSEAQNVAGAKEVAVGPAALRGQLTSTTTPRAVLGTLGTRTAQRKTGWTGPTPWY